MDSVDVVDGKSSIFFLVCLQPRVHFVRFNDIVWCLYYNGANYIVFSTSVIENDASAVFSMNEKIMIQSSEIFEKKNYRFSSTNWRDNSRTRIYLKKEFSRWIVHT